jgi:spore germination protein KB
LILPFLTIQEIDFSLLQPIFADGVKPIIAGSLVALNFPFTQITILALILPAVNDKNDSTPLYLLSYLIGSVLLLTRTILGVTIFSAEVIGKMLLPTYQIFRLVNIGEFLNRVEAFFIFVWILGFFTTLLAIYYALILGLSQLLGLKEKEPLIIPVGILIIFLSKLMFPSVSYFVYFAITLPIINISLNFFYPILLFFSSFFKKSPS